MKRHDTGPEPTPRYHCPRCKRRTPCTDPACLRVRDGNLAGVARARDMLRRSLEGDPPPPPTIEDTYA